MSAEEKFIITSSHYDNWDISTLNGKHVAEIRTFQGFRSKTKSLWVRDKKICDIRNQGEAIDKLNKFFMENKEEIKKMEQQIEELSVGITEVSHQVCVDALIKAGNKLQIKMAELKLYDMI